MRKGALGRFDFADLKARHRERRRRRSSIMPGPRESIEQVVEHAQPPARRRLRERQRRALFLRLRERHLDAHEARPARERLDRRRLDARSRRQDVRQRRGLPRTRRALFRRRRERQIREGEIPAAALRRVGHAGAAVRSDVERRHEDPVLRRAQEGHQARRREPDAALRLRRLPGLDDAELLRRPSASCGSNAAASTCLPTSAAAASSAPPGTKRA